MSEPLYFEIITPIDKKRDRMREADKGAIRKLSIEELKLWYFNAVKSVLILEKGFLPDEVDAILEKGELRECLEKYTEAQLHDDPHYTAESLRRFYPREVTPHYINFYFNALDYDDQCYSGAFYAPDNDIYCEFKYDRITGECCLYKENRPKEEILPLPIWWLDKKLEENGKLDSSESRICY